MIREFVILIYPVFPCAGALIARGLSGTYIVTGATLLILFYLSLPCPAITQRDFSFTFNPTTYIFWPTHNRLPARPRAELIEDVKD